MTKAPPAIQTMSRRLTASGMGPRAAAVPTEGALSCGSAGSSMKRSHPLLWRASVEGGRTRGLSGKSPRKRPEMRREPKPGRRRARRSSGRHEHSVPIVLHADDGEPVMLGPVERLGEDAEAEFSVIGEFARLIVMVEQQGE